MRVVLILIVTIAATTACRKDKVDCTANCVDVVISGKVRDAVSNKGFSNAPINVQWKYTRTCFTCIGTKKQLYSGKTDGQGNFRFSVSIDTTLFSDFNLQISTAEQKDYFSLFPYSVSEYAPVQLQNIDLAFYPKANLTLRLHRNQTDIFETFSVYHYFRHTDGSGAYTGKSDYIKSRQQIFGDTVIQTETAAGIFTTIQRRKSYANGTFKEETDSLIFTRTGNNVLDINY